MTMNSWSTEKDNVRIAKMESEHFDESIALSQFAFQYKRTAEEIEQTKEQYQAEPAERWGAFVNGQLAAQAAVLGLHTYVGGQRFAMGGIAGVATWPEFRRQGLVGQLLVHSLQSMRKKGQTLSFLAPFSVSFYRKYGWDLYTEYKAYTIEVGQLPARVRYAGRIERINGSVDQLNDIYDRFAIQFNGALVRTEQWWHYRINKRKPGHRVVYYDQNGISQGYLIYEAMNKELTVHELIHLTEEARAALWSFMAQHDSMIEVIKVNAPSNDILPYVLADPRIKQEIKPYFMARIVDAAAFIEQYPFHAGTSEDQIAIRLSDEYASWNDGEFMLNIDVTGKAKLAPVSASIKNTEQENAIKLDIGSLTTLLLGYRTADELSLYKRIHGDQQLINRLHRRIPERTTYMPDFF